MQGQIPAPQTDEAIAHYRQALRARPASAEVEYNLGLALLQQGNASEAITHLQHANELTGNANPTFLRTLAAARAYQSGFPPR